MNIFYERFIDLCKERGTTYNAVCLALGIRASSIGNLLSREKSVPKADTVLAVARYFNVSPEYLIGKTDEKELASESNKKTATSGDGNILDLSQLNEEQRLAINDLLRMNPQTLAVARPAIELFLSSQQDQGSSE